TFFRRILSGELSQLVLGPALHNDRRCDCRSGSESNEKERFLSHARISGGELTCPTGSLPRGSERCNEGGRPSERAIRSQAWRKSLKNGKAGPLGPPLSREEARRAHANR